MTERSRVRIAKCVAYLLLVPGLAAAEPSAEPLRQVQQYGFSIHILAMLLVGFGFLMASLKRYGYGAVTGTYLVVAASLPLYLGLRSSGLLSAGPVEAQSIHGLLLAEFAAAAALIAAGAVLGRLRLYQYVFLAALIVPLYLVNEWLVLDGGLELTRGFVDAAGSVTIHAFGAYFGLGLTVALTSDEDAAAPILSNETSDRFSLVGSMVLWVFWPSFCSAVVAPAQLAVTAVNTVLALCGATLTACAFSSWLRKGKVTIGDMANAALAGGVAIGATCNVARGPDAFAIGAVAGALCVIGYVVIQPRLQAALRIVDTCGVHNLHGMPGLLGGFAAAFMIPGIARPQLLGIAITVILAGLGGLVGGHLIRATGRKLVPYEEMEEFHNELE